MFLKIATILKPESGFAATGLYTRNLEVFTDENFVTAEIINSDKIVVAGEEIQDRNNTGWPNNIIY